VVLYKGRQMLEPEKRQLGENLAFIRDRVIHDHVKGGHAVACDNEEFILHFVDIPYFTPLDQLQVGELGFQEDLIRHFNSPFFVASTGSYADAQERYSLPHGAQVVKAHAFNTLEKEALMI
jgi:hypothetical protein